MIRITPTVNPMNRPPVVGKVPADGGTVFFAASDPAIAIAGMIIQKRPTSIAMAPVTLYQSVLPVRPAKADPLLPV